MERKQQLISPKKLYPTESLVFIKNETLQYYLKCLREGQELEIPLVFLFDGNYYILKGHHIVLASIMAHVENICVDIVDNKDISFWNDEKNIRETLNSLGMSTLYDFEAIGNFSYDTYPQYYKKD